jgi:hypothetical protein
MKMYPESKLPLKPEGLFERYLLYTFESRERWLGCGGDRMPVCAWRVGAFAIMGNLSSVGIEFDSALFGI